MNRQELNRFVRYIITGVLNTLITFLAFTSLRHFNVDLDVSNLLSYLAGICNSFLCNKFWVFRSKESRTIRECALFFLGAGCCWLVQWGIFRLLLLLLPETISYLTGMCSYTLSNYVFNRRITFKQKNKTSEYEKTAIPSAQCGELFP